MRHQFSHLIESVGDLSRNSGPVERKPHVEVTLFNGDQGGQNLLRVERPLFALRCTIWHVYRPVAGERRLRFGVDRTRLGMYRTFRGSESNSGRTGFLHLAARLNVFAWLGCNLPAGGG